MKGIALAGLILALAALACNLWPASNAGPTSTPAVQADIFFFGRAYLDTNGNGALDADDPPLEGAVLIARDAKGAESGGVTGANGAATAWYPGGITYPVTLTMRPAEDSDCRLIGPEKVRMDNVGSGGAEDFLFTCAP